MEIRPCCDILKDPRKEKKNRYGEDKEGLDRVTVRRAYK